MYSTAKLWSYSYAVNVLRVHSTEEKKTRFQNKNDKNKPSRANIILFNENLFTFHSTKSKDKSFTEKFLKIGWLKIL